MYVASEDKVQKFNRRGEVVKSVGKKGKNKESLIGHMVLDTITTKCMCVTARMAEYSCLTPTQSFGIRGDGPGQLKEPMDIDFDCQANIFVLDCEKHRVLVFSERGRYLHEFGLNELGLPQGLCVSDNYVYITDGKEGCCHEHCCMPYSHYDENCISACECNR